MILILIDLPDVTIQPIADYLRKIVNQINNEATSHQEKLIHNACMNPTEKACDIAQHASRILGWNTVAGICLYSLPINVIKCNLVVFTQHISKTN